MDVLNEDLDDSALHCMSLIKKRKGSNILNSKNSKQAKLNFGPTSPKTNNELPKEGCSSQCDEFKSAYFESKQSSHTCPLCLKRFESETNYSAHMKQCAKKRKMTTQQLLSALELQKKQMKERKALGLCPQICLPKKPKKKIDKNFQYDLALGLALSKSLDTNEPTASQTTTPTLEEFGFTSSNPSSEPTKKKGKIFKESILRERTKEERQRIITEKAAMVLLDEPEENELEKGKRNVSLKTSHLTKLQNQVPYLWNLGENERKSDWYVKQLKELVLAKEEEIPQVVLMEEEEIPQVVLEEEEIPRTSTPVVPENIQEEISKLKLPEGNIYEDWRKMINNEKLSDMTGRSKDNEIYYLHSIILFARCPRVLNEEDLGLILKKFNLSTILIFFEFLYCGTLNRLTRPEVEELLRLAVYVNHEELIKVLNCLEVHLTQSSSEGMIPSSLTPDLKSVEVSIIDEKREPEDCDIFEENMVDLTQSSHGSSTIDDDDVLEEESSADKSYWSFLQHEKELEEMRRREEEKENTEITTEMEKIETSMKQQHEMMQQILNEFEEENESDLKNKLELEKIYQMQRRESNDSTTKDLEEDFNKRIDGDDCILISSDSETQASKTDVKSPLEIKPIEDVDYDIPYFDPYDDFNNFSPVGFQEDVKSQSFITGDVSFTYKDTREEEEERKLNPECFSTPVTNRQVPRVNSSVKKSLNKKRRSNLSASRIIRKSLGLKPRISGSRRKKSGKKDKKSLKGGNELAEALTSSILTELSKSPLFKSSTPVRNRKLIEMTPSSARDSEFEECVTPSPNYSDMGDSVIKEHLSKYGLKRNLGKSKAKKILRHIYEELHPIINTKTGKLVKILPSDTQKGRNKSKATGTRKGSKSCKTVKKTESNRLNTSKDLDSTESVCSLDKSTDYDSDGSEFEDLNEPLTQSVPNSSVDLPSALSEFLTRNPGFHRKILLYEPIWLEELQKNLKETFKKHFKLSDLMDYLDQKCITFRSAAQNRNNKKRNEKKKKKTSPS